MLAKMKNRSLDDDRFVDTTVGLFYKGKHLQAGSVIFGFGCCFFGSLVAGNDREQNDH